MGLPPPGVTPQQMQELKSKDRTWPHRSEEDRWRDIYNKLFPNDEVMPSPRELHILGTTSSEELMSTDYVPPQEQLQLSPECERLADFEHYQHREVPGLVRSRVEDLARQNGQLDVASLIVDLAGIVQECQEQACRAWRNRQPDKASRDELGSTAMISGDAHPLGNTLGEQQQRTPNPSGMQSFSLPDDSDMITMMPPPDTSLDLEGAVSLYQPQMNRQVLDEQRQWSESLPHIDSGYMTDIAASSNSFLPSVSQDDEMLFEPLWRGWSEARDVPRSNPDFFGEALGPNSNTLMPESEVTGLGEALGDQREELVG